MTIVFDIIAQEKTATKFPGSWKMSTDANLWRKKEEEGMSLWSYGVSVLCEFGKRLNEKWVNEIQMTNALFERDIFA